MSIPKHLLDRYPSLKKIEEAGDDYTEFNDGRETRLLNYIYQHPSLAELRGNPTKLLAVIDEFAGQEDFLISVGPHKACVLGDLVEAALPRVLVEFGGYLGYSAILFADTIRRALPAGQTFRVWSLEFDPLFASIALNLVDLAGLSDNVKVVTGPATDSLRRLKAEGALNHIDVLFLDHVEYLYDADLKVVESLGLLKPGAQVWADNVVRPGAPHYRVYVRSHPGWESKGVRGLIQPGDLEDEIEVTYIQHHNTEGTQAE